MMFRKGQEKLMVQREVQNRVKRWIAIGVVAEVSRVVAQRFQRLKDRYRRRALEDASARRIQGFVLRVMRRKSLTLRELSLHDYRVPEPDSLFKLERGRDPRLVGALKRLRKKITSMLV